MKKAIAAPGALMKSRVVFKIQPMTGPNIGMRKKRKEMRPRGTASVTGRLKMRVMTKTPSIVIRLSLIHI